MRSNGIDPSIPLHLRRGGKLTEDLMTTAMFKLAYVFGWTLDQITSLSIPTFWLLFEELNKLETQQQRAIKRGRF